MIEQSIIFLRGLGCCVTFFWQSSVSSIPFNEFKLEEIMKGVLLVKCCWEDVSFSEI